MPKQLNPTFEQVINDLTSQYPSADLRVEWDYDRHIVYAYGKQQFCPDGFNLLYNLKRLVETLKEELR